jgi:hypothetical protein
LTVSVTDVPIKKILEHFVDQTGIEVVLHASGDELVSTNFADLPLEKGLKRLCRNLNHAIIYGPAVSGKKETKIEVIIFFSKGGTRSEERVKPRLIEPKMRALDELSEDPSDSLIKALESQDADVREDAVDRLAELKDERISSHLSQVLLSDESPDVRESAASALGDLGSKEAIDALTAALRDRDADVRETTVESLAQIGGEEVIPVLKRALEDGDEDVREAAAIALKQLTGEDYSEGAD